mmetsp:Transcript_8137/g.19408  ORF Transcript_8137/g.19408 Transcript_8137/m.19408 type:complete len:221 (+) Transcript_8137:1245-1907(+)
MLLAEVDGLLEDPGVASIRDESLGVPQCGVPRTRLGIGGPHPSAQPIHASNHRRHGSIDNHIAWHVQIGDATVRINHCKLWLRGEAIFDVLFNLLSLCIGQLADFVLQITEPVVGIHSDLLQDSPMLLKNPAEKDFHCVTKNDRIRDFHHRSFKMQRQEHLLRLGVRHLVLKVLLQRFDAHEGRIQHLAGYKRQLWLQHRHFSIRSHMLNASGARSSDLN